MSPAALSPSDAAKHAVASAAVERFVEPGMTLGLGSGSTAALMVEILGARVREGLELRGVATSQATAELARGHGIELVELDEVDQLDLTLDGADEVDGERRMIKGGGGCLLQEKIVALNSRRMVAMIDATKLVARLGAFPLPVEVVPFAVRTTRHRLTGLLAELGQPGAIELRGGDAAPFVTDNGNHILDCRLGAIAEPERLAAALDHLTGVVEHGLFLGIADAVLIGRADGGIEAR